MLEIPFLDRLKHDLQRIEIYNSNIIRNANIETQKLLKISNSSIRDLIDEVNKEIEKYEQTF